MRYTGQLLQRLRLTAAKIWQALQSAGRGRTV
jgi:hypothetical protein